MRFSDSDIWGTLPEDDAGERARKAQRQDPEGYQLRQERAAQAIANLQHRKEREKDSALLGPSFEAQLARAEARRQRIEPLLGKLGLQLQHDSPFITELQRSLLAEQLSQSEASVPSRRSSDRITIPRTESLTHLPMQLSAHLDASGVPYVLVQSGAESQKVLNFMHEEREKRGRLYFQAKKHPDDAVPYVDVQETPPSPSENLERMKLAKTLEGIAKEWTEPTRERQLEPEGDANAWEFVAHPLYRLWKNGVGEYKMKFKIAAFIAGDTKLLLKRDFKEKPVMQGDFYIYVPERKSKGI